jgi:UDP-N-acetylmuramoylalanine--D-glutamate ligase
MKKINFTNKKVGIWGMGIVGKSVLEFVKKFTDKIQLMDKKTDPQFHIIPETPQNIKNFLHDNDIIIPSPGIVLHDYQNFAHKFVNELDIFAQNFTGTTVAITGTVGKTTVTSLLSQCMPNSVAAGNIGHAMLNLLQSNNVRPECLAQAKSIEGPTTILELSSYQLQFAKYFAPDLAIWTNFYPNHLDHHANETEYFIAKCNMLKNQRTDQIALLPYNLIEQITAHVTPKAQIFLFETKNTTTNKNFPTFFVHNNQLLLKQNNQTRLIFNNFNHLPDITFEQNWIIILAALYLQNIPLQQILTFAQTLKPEPHRLEFVKNIDNVAIYNDSKSTVWQATEQAVQRFESKRIALFLGGISKGTDRSPLIKSLQNKPITVFAFGKEADILSGLCTQFQIGHHSATTLEQALTQFQIKQNNFDILLFSPAGASFDLFKNFEDRGDQFKAMIAKILG